MMDKFEEYLNEPIELDDLDTKWKELPSVYHHYCDLLTEASESHEEAKTNLDKKKAEFDDKIRRDPDEYNLAKTTEAAIANKINELITDTKEWKIYLDTKHEYNIVQNKIKKLDMINRALSKLSDLFISSYFIGPREPKQITKGKEMADKTVKRQRKSLKK